MFAVDLKCFCHVEEKVAGQSKYNLSAMYCNNLHFFFAFFVLFFQCEGGAWLVSQCPVKMRHWEVPVLASCTLCLHFVCIHFALWEVPALACCTACSGCTQDKDLRLLAKKSGALGHFGGLLGFCTISPYFVFSKEKPPTWQTPSPGL